MMSNPRFEHDDKGVIMTSSTTISTNNSTTSSNSPSKSKARLFSSPLAWAMMPRILSNNARTTHMYHHSKYWWRMPAIVFLCLLLVEYSLESYYAQSVIREGEEGSDGNSSLLVVAKSTTIVGPTETQKQKQKYNQQQQQEVQVQTTAIWADLDLDQQCHFPGFFELGKQPFNLSATAAEGGWVNPKEWRDNLFSQQFDESNEQEEQTNEYYQMLIRKQHSDDFASLQVERNISFVHIGKAGGSSIGCNLAASRRFVRKHCENRQMPVSLSAISIHVNCYTHWQGHMYCYDNNDSFLINVRNPVQRMASWFLYEHVRNHEVNYKERNYHCGDLMLFSCFDTFQELAILGLQGDRPPSNQKLRVGSNLTQQECSHWAWAAVQGNIPASYHNAYNYEWYTHRIFRREKQITEIFVLRAEHFEDDWTTIDQLLGGTGVFPESMKSKQNSASKKELPVADSSVTNEGIRNLCRALCREIQIYKRILDNAVNLNTDNIAVSMEELRQTCPREADLTLIQECGY